MNNLLKKMNSLINPEARSLYVSANLNVGLAFQIRRLREVRGWTQAELAERTNKKQSVISQLEDHDYGNYTLKTLRSLAEAYDVGLSVKFVAFSDLVQKSTDLTDQVIAPKAFDDDRAEVAEQLQLPGFTHQALMGTEINLYERESVIAPASGAIGISYQLPDSTGGSLISPNELLTGVAV